MNRANTNPAVPHVPGQDSAFANAVLEGLGSPRKSIPSTWLYDQRGSQLFEDITRLPEYYPTRCEIEILERHGEEIAARVPPDATVVEFGSGSSRKTPLLLSVLRRPHTYVPLDVAQEFMTAAVGMIEERFPDIQTLPRVLDFMKDFSGGLHLPEDSPRIGFFPGSTIGNLSPEAAVRFLRRAGEALGPDAVMIIGVDIRKPLPILLDAYNDQRGITAAFNKNLLARINRELQGGFDPASFHHEARYDTTHHRIEMHLVSTRAQVVPVLDRSFSFRPGETIHTENSYKFTLEGFANLAMQAGWRTTSVWQDSQKLFSVQLLAPRSVQPC